MNPARAPREQRSSARLLALDAETGQYADLQAVDLPSLLRPGDVLCVNDAATLPASLSGQTAAGAAIELRLAGFSEWGQSGSGAEGGASDETYWAVLFGPGDWRIPTERRPEPPRLVPGDRLRLGEELGAEVVEVAALSPRLLKIRFDRRGAALWSALYAHGRPVQYSYLQQDLALWSVQTVYGARPWAAEMPSAGRPLSWDLLAKLRAAGVQILWLTHAAGLSSTGEPGLDAALPLPERYEIPETTTAAILRARRSGGRVIAVGTTVVRAIEGAVQNAEAAGHPRGTLLPGGGVTDLVLDDTTQLRIVDGILTGIHGPEESHFRLLSAFCPLPHLRAGWAHAAEAGYLCHEFGDLELIAPGLVATEPRAKWSQPEALPKRESAREGPSFARVFRR